LFSKGYKDDIGIDICLDFDVVFEPFETKVIDVGVGIPTYNRMAIMMCSRTSAAEKGIIVNPCPIDPNYEGNVHIIAHNCSNETVTFKAGTAFAQMYAFDVQRIEVDYNVRRHGYRGENAFGSTND
jgi:dUTPase